MSLMFNNGTAEVRITKDGTTYTRKELPYLFNSVASVEADVGAGFVSTIKVVLTPSFKDGLDILRSGLIGVGLGKAGQKPERVNEGDGLSSKSSQAVGGTVASPSASQSERAPTLKSTAGFIEVRFVYPNQDNDGLPAQTPWFTGMMVRPDISISGANIEITLNARSSAGILSDVQGAFTFEKQPALDVIKDLAKPIELEITFDEDDTQTEDILTKKIISGSINEPRLQAIKSILFKLDCFWATTSGEEGQPKTQLRVKARKRVGAGKIEFTFVMFRQIDPTNNVIPIYDFNLESTGPLFMTGGAFGTFQRCLLEKTKKSETVEKSGKDIDGKNLSGAKTGGGNLVEGEPTKGGSTGLTNLSDAELTGSSHIVVMRDDGDNLDEIITATARGVFFGPRYNLVLPGLPRLRPLSLCQIIVANKITGISGVGFVKKINHVLGGDGWKTMCQFNQTGGLGDGETLSNFSNVDVQDPPRQTSSTLKQSSSLDLLA